MKKYVVPATDSGEEKQFDCIKDAIGYCKTYGIKDFYRIVYSNGNLKKIKLMAE